MNSSKYFNNFCLKFSIKSFASALRLRKGCAIRWPLTPAYCSAPPTSPLPPINSCPAQAKQTFNIHAWAHFQAKAAQGNARKSQASARSVGVAGMGEGATRLLEVGSMMRAGRVRRSKMPVKCVNCLTLIYAAAFDQKFYCLLSRPSVWFR